MSQTNSRSVGEEPAHWFQPVAEHLGTAYLRYSFTKGTVNEIDFVTDLLGGSESRSILDLGCGPGRHALELARRGHRVTGVDISETFIGLAQDQARGEGLASTRFQVGDARRLSFDAEFDLAISLCQGGFGLTGGPRSPGQVDLATISPAVELDEPVLSGLAAAVKPGGLVVVSAFSAYFQLRYLEQSDSFDADLGVNEEETSIRNADGEERAVRLWTTCYTPRELRLLARAVDLEVEAIFGVTPGSYGRNPPTIDCPEFLLVARRRSSVVEAQRG